MSHWRLPDDRTWFTLSSSSKRQFRIQDSNWALVASSMFSAPLKIVKNGALIDFYILLNGGIGEFVNIFDRQFRKEKKVK